jgi:twin arginine-targeting protein translocase, TatA/E family
MDLFAPQHLIIILLIVVLLFGGKKIPELMRGLGRGIREFNDAKNNVKREIEEGMNEPPKQINSNQAQQNNNQSTTTNNSSN